MYRLATFSRLDDQATPAPGATVTIRQAGSAVLANLYDSDNLLDPKANPFTTGQDGLAEAYAENGRYDIEFSGGGIVTPWSLGDQIFFDPADQASVARTFNVQDYGAVGDGTTDDTAAIQSAIDAAAATVGGGDVYFPQGRYRCTATLTCTTEFVTFSGDGSAFSVLIWDDNATKGLTIIGSAALVSQALAANGTIGDRAVTLGSASGLVVGGWAFLDDSQTRGGTLLTKIGGIAGAVVTLEDALPCRLLTASTATLYSYTALLRGVAVRKLALTCTAARSTASKLTLLQFTRCDAPVAEDLYVDGSVGPLVTLSTCYNACLQRITGRNALTVAGTGIEVQTSTGTSFTLCTMTMCQFGLVGSASPYSRLTACRVDGRATSVALGRGIKLQDQSNFSAITGCVVTDPNLYAIYLQDTAHTTVTGNTAAFTGSAVDTGQHGIQVGGFEADFCHHNTITGNTIRGASGYGIAVQPTAGAAQDLYTVITGNTISNCLWGAIFCGFASRGTITGNVVSGAGATVVGGIIRVSFGSDYTVIVGNTVTNEDANGTTGITTAGGGGHSEIGPNPLGANLTNAHAATDSIWATRAYVDTRVPKAPVFNATDVLTPATTDETTAWATTIAANSLTATTHGFRMRGIFTFANNANLKTVRVYIGATVFEGAASLAGGPYQVEFDLEVFFLTANGAQAWCNFWSTKVSGSGNTPGGTHAAVTIDWTVNQVITVTMQNGVASAGDIAFRAGKLTYEGVPQG